MKHLGDITKISGYGVPVVDCVIGGSPCQDLSQAGLRKGLGGARSGLYIDQIRIIKEMREYDQRMGRSGVDVRPRYMVWENVPGAFSTNGGKDFAAVLEEAIRVAEPEAPSVSVPKKGWPTAGSFMGECWSIAWRVLDAQFWGTSDKPLPQRRRRIALVADFGGHSAPEILFVRKSVSGNLEPGKPKGKETAGDAGDSVGGAIGCDLYNGSLSGDKAVSLNTNANATGAGSTVAVPKAVGFPLGFRPENVRCYDETATTLCNGTRPGFTTGVIQPVVYGISPFHSNCMKSDNPHSGVYVADTSRTLDALNCGYPGCNQGGMAVVQPVGTYQETGFGRFNESDVGATIRAMSGGKLVQCRHIVRRLTPLECERLQGFPDNWTLIGEPVVEDVADYAYIFDESKYIAPNPADFGLTDEDLNDYAPVDDENSIDDEDVYDDNYLEYLDACAKARSKATKRVKVGSHKETNYYYTDSNGKRKKVSDSPRYKALGNSIALPPWKWVLKRLSACYERDATMASLFDGIGGFPLIWEQINGKGSCLWASEIEEFPMAVTKLRFGGNDYDDG